MNRTKTPTFFFRDYQSRAYRRLFSSFLKHKENLLAFCTGSGKTPVSIAVVSKLQEKYGLCVYYSTPPLNARKGLSKYSNKTIDVNQKGILRATPVQTRNIETELSSSQICAAIMSIYNDGIIASTHHTSVNVFKELRKLGDVDLSKFLLVVDEAHHKSLDKTDMTVLGEFIAYVKKNGGSILYVSATPYREYRDRTELIYDPATIGRIEIRTIGDQMREGYAPSVSVKYMNMDSSDVLMSNGDIFGDLPKSHLKRKALIKYTKQIIESWIEDGCPKCIFLIPAGNSEEDAVIVKRLFEEVVFNTDIASRRGRNTPSILVTLEKTEHNIDVDGVSTDALNADSANNGRLFDVIIGCRKFDEATDVPSASHLYMIGIPSNVRLFHQRIGRILRSKLEVQGYADFFGDTWLNHSKIAFMAPYGSVIDNFSTQVSNQLLITILAGDAYEDFCSATSHVGLARIEIENIIDTFDDEDRELAEEFATKINSLEVKYNAERAKSELNLFKAYIHDNPTIGEVYDSIIYDTSITTNEKIDNIYALIQHMNCDPELIRKFARDSVNVYVIQRKKAKNKSKVLNSNKIIHDGFKRIVDEFRDTQLTESITDNIKSIYTDLTGDIFESYSKRIVQELNDNNVIHEFTVVENFVNFKKINDRDANVNSTNKVEKQIAEDMAEVLRKYKIMSGNDEIE